MRDPQETARIKSKTENLAELSRVKDATAIHRYLTKCSLIAPARDCMFDEQTLRIRKLIKITYRFGIMQPECECSQSMIGEQYLVIFIPNSWGVPMFSTADRQVFGVRLTCLEAIEENIMWVRIICPDKSLHRAQTTEYKGISALPKGNPMACYMDRKSKFRSLSGSA
jgi:hypothetical protein